MLRHGAPTHPPWLCPTHPPYGTPPISFMSLCLGWRKCAHPPTLYALVACLYLWWGALFRLMSAAYRRP